jgi:hypothetical protein
MGWGSIKNGKLLKLVEDDQFDVLLTGDRNLWKAAHEWAAPGCGGPLCDQLTRSGSICPKSLGWWIQQSREQ